MTRCRTCHAPILPNAGKCEECGDEHPVVVEIAGLESHAFALAFAHWFGLQPVQSRVLTTLYRATGGFCSIPLIGGAHALSRGAVHTAVFQIRKALESEALDCVPGYGYRLTDEGLAECRGALWQMGELLRRAS